MAFEESLSERLSRLQIRSSEIDERYLQTYDLFLDYFKRRIAVKSVELNDAKIAVVLVYSWMGRAQIDPACWINFEKLGAALAVIRRSAPEEHLIDTIRSFVGGSLIATSKFLHFLEPQRFAIWDQHVARAAYRYQYPYQYNKVDRYLCYLKDIDNLVLDERVNERVLDTLGRQVSPLRAKEFALFHLGISEPRE